MRALVTTDSVGGVWPYAIELATGLAPLGIEAVLAVLGPPLDRRQRTQARAAGVRVIETGLPLDWLCDAPAPMLAAGERIAALARETAADLVQLNMPTLGTARFDRPVIVVAHGCLASWWEAANGTALPASHEWQQALTQAGFAAADRIVAPTAAYAVTIRRLYGLTTPPVAIHNGRRALAPPGRSAPVDAALTVGRLWDQVKNTPLLDRVAARLPMPFHAAGALRGPHGETVAPAHLRPLGQIGTAELARRLAQRPIFISAARFEPFGLAVLEAALAGCALVLSDLPGFRELWDGAALFVAADDEAGFAAAIGQLRADPATRAMLGTAARARARGYTPAATAAAMAALYAEVLGRPFAAARAAA